MTIRNLTLASLSVLLLGLNACVNKDQVQIAPQSLDVPAEIKAKITDLFANLKESDTIPLIIEGIRNQKYAPELKSLISSCWENGLDYSKYIPLFVDLLIDNEFDVAFEAYTVIMNTESQMNTEIIDQEIERMEKVLATVSEQKRQLLIDVIDYLPTLRS